MADSLTDLSAPDLIVKKDAKGNRDYVLMETGSENQMKIGAYQGCETVSLYNGLVYLDATKGKSVKDVLNELPKLSWGSNPNDGYAGDPWTPDDQIPDGGYPTIWPTALVEFAKQFAPGTRDISGSSMNTIEQEILSGRPVEMWVTIGLDAPLITYTDYFGHKALMNTHAVLLDGYDENKQAFHVTDPIKGKYWISVNTISSIYFGTNEFAISLAN